MHGLGCVEVSHSGVALVEGVAGDLGPEGAFGEGKRQGVVVGGADIVVAVGPLDSAAGRDRLGGEEAGPVEVEERAELFLSILTDAAPITPFTARSARRSVASRRWMS